MLSTINSSQNSQPNFKSMVLKGVPCLQSEITHLHNNKGLSRLTDNLSQRNKNLYVQKCCDKTGTSYLLSTEKNKKHNSPYAGTSYKLGVYKQSYDFNEVDADFITKALDTQIEWDKTMDIYRDMFEGIQGGKVKVQQSKKGILDKIIDLFRN